MPLFFFSQNFSGYIYMLIFTYKLKIYLSCSKNYSFDILGLCYIYDIIWGELISVFFFCQGHNMTFLTLRRKYSANI